ncbi:MAG TPA: dihydroorotase [Ignavibacteria bacterium]|nr:dihydroorotase [Ignavibacteria bacterium]
MNILFKNIEIITSKKDDIRRADILIINGIIEKIGNISKIPKDTEVIDSKSLTCTTGFYDMHVHFREPGQTHKENLLTGSLSAMNGGFTGVMCMPNTTPPLDNVQLISSLKEKTKNYLLDVDFTACVTKNREGKELANIISLSDSGVLAFTDDGSPVANTEILRRAFEYTAQCNSLIVQHAEDMTLSNYGVMNEGYYSTTQGLRGIPVSSETSIIARDIEICRNIKNARYHLQHLSCGDSVDIFRNAKKSNTEKFLKYTTEVCPHHFTLTDSATDGFNTNAKMNPPLRTKKDIDKILEGLKDGTIDVICTDHAPHTEMEKSLTFEKAPFGIVGLETCVGLTYTYLVKTGIISIYDMIAKLSDNPRKILNLKPINIKEGEKANLTILDITKKWTVDKNSFLSKSKNTPFDEYKLTCKPFAVVNNDKIFYSEL